ncbi:MULTISPECIES: GNAT family N-acetyltransferase [unclassified Ruminococcus]|uniref:GNAT family N-acetyltransferase n=1 Tax=unclassified Ruminococcus TaxID=2608920 RepID=UPI00210CBD7E|nr:MULTISPECIES: GNAT family protein [unclassified Ruminococcus]MCQ4021947.1 GNAT family N-acetyltransferase [Ruminococcus sp. zg-924]MCQ4114483.1 GNAT family N-acetyltransferase [Ruminococcus sp. zg-921]
MSFYIQYGDIIIKEYNRTDLDSVHSMLSQPNVYYTTCAIPYNCSRAFASMWIDCIRRSAKRKTDFEYGIFSARNGEYIGNIGLIGIDYINKCADITYIIHPRFQNRGYACLASKLIIAYGFEFLNLQRIQGKCMDFNIASKTVMLKCGFTYEGLGRQEMLKDNKFVNLEHYSLLKSEYEALKNKIFIPLKQNSNFS